MIDFPLALINQSARIAQEVNAARTLGAFIAYAREIGCTVGEGALHDSIAVHTEEQAALLDAKWGELTS